MTQTLAGIHIVSTAANVPGPVAAAMLRDMGAAVVKVEAPAGDPLAFGAPDWYAELCAGIDVRRIDLKSDAERDQFDALLATADVLITATRPASLRRLGLSWEAVHARHPRLCQIAIVGFPAPRQEEAGHDLTYQANAALLTPPAMPRTLIADLAGAQRTVIATLELLLARERSGQAARVEVALSEAASLFAEPLRHGLTQASGWLGGRAAGYNIYRARDGWVAVAALEPHFRTALSRELAIDVNDRIALARVLAERGADDWQRWAVERGLPLAAVR